MYFSTKLDDPSPLNRCDCIHVSDSALKDIHVGQCHFKKDSVSISISNFVIVLPSGASSLAKHGGAYFSAVYGSIEDPVAAPGHCKPQVC